MSFIAELFIPCVSVRKEFELSFIKSKLFLFLKLFLSKLNAQGYTCAGDQSNRIFMTSSGDSDISNLSYEATNISFTSVSLRQSLGGACLKVPQ